jgi:hypothetical protein
METTTKTRPAAKRHVLRLRLTESDYRLLVDQAWGAEMHIGTYLTKVVANAVRARASSDPGSAA